MFTEFFAQARHCSKHLIHSSPKYSLRAHYVLGIILGGGHGVSPAAPWSRAELVN